METYRKFQINFENTSIILAVIFFLVHLFFLNTPFNTDEGTHTLVSMFYRDIIKYIFSGHFSFQDIYNYAIKYLVYYPKISLYYLPLYYLINFVIFNFYPGIIAARLMSLILMSISIYLMFKLVYLFTEDERVSFLSTLLFATSTLVNESSVLAMGEATLLFSAILAMYLFYNYYAKNKFLKTALLFLPPLIFARQQSIFVFISFIFLIILNKQWKKFVILIVPFILYILFYILQYKLGLIPVTLKTSIIDEIHKFPELFSFDWFTYYPLSFLFSYLIFPMSFLSIIGFFYWFKERKPWQILLLNLFFINFLFFQIVRNKGLRFPILCIIPLSIASAQIASKLFIGKLKFLLLSALLILGACVYNYGFLTQKNFDFSFINLINDTGDVLIASENADIYSSVIIAEYAKNHPRDRLFYRPCSIFYYKVISDNVHYVLLVQPPNEALKDELAKNINYILSNNNLTILFSTHQNENIISLYENLNYNSSVTSKCNYICILDNKVCYK